MPHPLEEPAARVRLHDALDGLAAEAEARAAQDKRLDHDPAAERELVDALASGDLERSWFAERKARIARAARFVPYPSGEHRGDVQAAMRIAA